MNRHLQFDAPSVSRAQSRKRIITLLAVVAIGATSMMLVSAQAPSTTSGIILLVGANESQRVVNWYASANT